MRNVRHVGVVLVLGVAACGGAPGAGGANPVTTTAGSAENATKGAGDAGDAIPKAPESQQPNRCAKGGPFPALSAAPKPATEPKPLPCRASDKAAESSVAAEMRAQFKPTRPGSTLDVSFGCDGLDQPIARLVYERGVGHGNQLEIVQISRPDPAGASYDVIGIRESSPFMSNPKTPPFQVVRAKVPTDAVHARMPFVRAALQTTLREVLPKSGLTGYAAFGSSSTMHALVRIEDAAGRSIEKKYSDAINSDGQGQFLPLLRADAEIRQIIDKLPWQDEPASGDVLKLFEERFLAAMVESPAQDAWWVRAAYLELAGRAGARSLVPSILGLLDTPRPEGPSSDAWERKQEAAMEALAKLTGWDARKDAKGATRPIEAAARDFVAECGKVSPVAR
ncbi:hypothetical protein [Polyangium sp. 15x6]|uniref:hypothetical protein n=1 Tax=Polyangium sp. 15x6 TaxID=3042687 RepID=UPI00249CB834|nr:hypothetical protein [Polyangium sp. 15x6]MDI3292151.1 hypothetical protein [Polyangium sp. 15x6]